LLITGKPARAKASSVSRATFVGRLEKTKSQASGGAIGPTSAYTFHLALVGFFFVAENYPKDKVEILAKTNCPAVLYSTAREMLVTVVRRSPFTPVLIPSVTFLEIENKEDEQRKASSPKNKPARKLKTTK
jgi:preprotein translocase subunit SecB